MDALDGVIESDRPLRELEAGLFSALDPDDEGAPYDSRAAAYDRLVASDWYSRVAWGVRPDVHTDFIARGFASEDEGRVLDVAAGSCVSSAAAYAETSRPVVVLDRSLAMLRRGRARVIALRGEVPPRIAFLQADAGALPIRSGTFASVVCHGAFHVFASPETVAAECARVLRSGGKLFASSLVRGRWLGDRYLGLLHRAGEVTRPRTPGEFSRLVESAFGASGEVDAIGNFAYLTLRKQG
jgi:ubiquinone/menaquinone biosynthesis C-methylase UbiE